MVKKVIDVGTTIALDEVKDKIIEKTKPEKPEKKSDENEKK